MIAYTAKVLHQPIKFVESRPAVSLCAFSNKSEFLKDSDGVVEFLPGERISPCRPGNREDVGEMGKIIAAGLRLDILSELFCERHQGLAGNVAAFELAEVTGLDRPKNLGFRPQNHVFGLDNVAVDGRRQRWIFPAFQPSRLFEFGFALDDPGICRLFAVERFGLTVFAPPFFMTIWAVKALEPSLRVRPIIVPMVRHESQKYDIVVPQKVK